MVVGRRRRAFDQFLAAGAGAPAVASPGGPWTPLVSSLVPVLIGNIIGGTALFALIAYAQVMKEI
jgi:formate/nitrite transporter FocA (FNT family)